MASKAKSQLEVGSGSDSEEEIAEVQVRSKPAGFAALMELEGGSGDSDDKSSGDEKEEVIEEVKKKVETAAKTGNKKVAKKGKKGKAAAEEDDIDKLLEELDKPLLKEEKPTKKGKKGKAAAEEDDIDKLLEELDRPLLKEEKPTKKAKKEKQAEQNDEEETPPVEKDQKEEETTVENNAEPETAELDGEVEAAEGETGKKAKDKKKKKKDKKKAEDKDEKEDEKKTKLGGKAKQLREALKQHEAEKAAAAEQQAEAEKKKIEAAQEFLRKQEEEKEARAAKRQAKKDRDAKLKAEGKYLTPAQKQAQERQRQMLEMLKQQGYTIPAPGSKPKPKYGKPKPKNKQSSAEPEPSPEPEEVKPSPEVAEEVEKEPEAESEEDDLMESWDMVADEKETREPEAPKKIAKQPSAEDEEDEDEESESDEDEEESSSEESESADDVPTHETKEQALERIALRLRKRQQERRSKVSTDDLRSPVVCVLGHVDTGKTSLLDNIRKTNVQDSEAGGITQQIGATMVPVDTVKGRVANVREYKDDLKIPGLLIIDTPGHESFSNLRSRGSSLCDIAILVVDIMHGLEPQTLESIKLLQKNKTPFVVALNKIDRLYQWKTNPHKDIRNVIKSQQVNAQAEFNERLQATIVAFAEQSINTCLFSDNKDPTEYVSLVPTSAHSADGMGNLIYEVVKHCETELAKKIAYHDDVLCTVLEVKALPGLGTTIDVILVNGKLKVGDTVVLAGTEGPIVTQIRELLMPQPLREIRVKTPYQHFKELRGAQGIKVLAKDLEKSLAGLQLYVAEKEDEVEYLKAEVSKSLKAALESIKMQDHGVYVQASTLGSLEALLEFLRHSKIPYSGLNVGPVHKKDVMKASTMLEHDEGQFAVILAFDVKVERDAQELADSTGVRIFQADIIYHLFDAFIKFREDWKAAKRAQHDKRAVFPCMLKVMPQFVFNARSPLVMGVSVEAGVLRRGTPICVPSRESVYLGEITSLQLNHKDVETARKGQEVCVKIELPHGEAPRMFGRHFDENDVMVSRISRDSIDVCKKYFREDLQKADWQLIVELKKLLDVV